MSRAHLELVDPAANAHLSGRFAPVDREVDESDLPVEGTLPADLTGAYVRNGPNPRFTPLGSYTYPMEGDGMLHGVWLENGRARYRNRWVYTNGLRAEMRAGQALFGGWDGERPTRIAVIDRSGSAPTRWIETDPFFAWHYGNAYEQDDEVVLDFPWWSAFTLGSPGSSGSASRSPVRGGFAHVRLRPDSGKASIELLDDIASEFPRIDDRRIGQPHRYVTTSRRSGRHELVTGEFDQLARHDLRTGTTDTYDADVIFGEVVFAPRDGAVDDLDGYYLTYATTPDAKRSWLLLWDAPTFPSDPVARVETPQRVPHGLHGNWFRS